MRVKLLLILVFDFGNLHTHILCHALKLLHILANTGACGIVTSVEFLTIGHCKINGLFLKMGHLLMRDILCP